MRILLIDDEQGIRLILRRLLERNGHVVFEAETGADAILCAQKIDAAIVDLSLPDMSGQEVIRALRQKNHELKMVVLSGSVDEDTDDLIQSTDIGDLSVIRKPFDAKTVLSALET